MTTQATDTYNVLGNILRFLATSPQTGGAYSLVEGLFPPGHGAPPNRHPGDDEAFYVLDGSFEFMVDGKPLAAPTGTFVRVPNGAVHAFKNVGDSAGKVLIINSPGRAHDGFFKEVGEPLASGTTDFPPAKGPPDIPKLLEIGRRHGLEFFL